MKELLLEQDSHRLNHLMLNSKSSLQQRLVSVHSSLMLHFPAISRIGVALYEEHLDLVYTYIYSDLRPSPFNHYQQKLADCSSLFEVARTCKPRIINNIRTELGSDTVHTDMILKVGFNASATFPMTINEQLLGFVFFNSAEEGYFSSVPEITLGVFAQLITFMIHSEYAKFRSVIATTRSAYSMLHCRDPETGSHLARVSLYTKLIATKVAEQFGLSDQQVESIFQYSMLHDMGKLRIPDSILLKQGQLDAEEFLEMQKHTLYGEQLIRSIVDSNSDDQIPDAEILCNIVRFHHEKYDGTGYPDGLSGEDIPIEARIVAVADIFDALTTERSYKVSWTNQQALNELQRCAAKRELDPVCVDAFVEELADIEEIQHYFAD